MVTKSFSAPTHRFARVLIGVTTVAGMMAAAIAWRVADRPISASLLSIFGWQLLVWLPWVGYFFVVRYLVRRLGTYQDASLAGMALHIIAALLIATSHLVWYWQVSSHISPFLGAPKTRYGAYAFFFVFWFLIDLLAYWAVFLRPGSDDSAQEELASSARVDSFIVRKGQSQHLVRTADIRWIEELDPDRFIRVHRSTIVNVDEIRGLKRNDSGSQLVVLADGTSRGVSRTGSRKLGSVLPSGT